ncbi:head-tail connector protein [Bacillus sp. FSL W8-0223]|uniref:head-tail connector protein n=1 Tax=Bacillus sp. FSL W8-0223 TaxID=2954595 RepID=UPI0030FB932D
MELTQLKNYLRIDHDLDDDLLTYLKSVAESYIQGSIDSTDDSYKIDPRFDYATALLVSHWYENRSATSDINLQDIPFGVQAIIQQLRGLINNA